MHTLNDNYKRNIAVLRENIKRGLTAQAANGAINGMEKQFINANLYDDDAKQFIGEMRQVVSENFIKATDLMAQMGVKVVKL